MTVNGESLFETLVDAFSGRPGVSAPGESEGRGFGSGALKVNGSIFAMVPRGGLTLKLPKTRVAQLVAAGQAVHFDANKGTPMKEWVVLLIADPEPVLALAEEAFDFVGSKARTK
jgi:hypothetical protein